MGYINLKNFWAFLKITEVLFAPYSLKMIVTPQIIEHNTINYEYKFYITTIKTI